jgi:hypothetical protein
MGKLIFWLVLVFGVLFALRMWNTSKLRAARRDEPGGKPPKAMPMIKCVECGVFLPAADASTTAGGYRCGDPSCPNRKRGAA